MPCVVFDVTKTVRSSNVFSFHCIWNILLVRHYQEDCVFQFLTSRHCLLHLLLAWITLLWLWLHSSCQCCRSQKWLPMCYYSIRLCRRRRSARHSSIFTDLQLIGKVTTDVPHLKLDIAIDDFFNVTADCWLCLYYLSEIASIKSVDTVDRGWWFCLHWPSRVWVFWNFSWNWRACSRVH